MTTYKIVRYLQHGSNEVQKTGLTLAEAQEHCNHPATSSKTATSAEAQQLTRERGSWFDGYVEE